MARKQYITVAIPKQLMAEVDLLIKDERQGYASGGEFTKQAIRDLLKKTRRT